MNHNIASSNFTITSLVKKSQKSLKVESWPLKSKIKGCQIIWSKVTCFVKVVKYRGVFAVTNFNIDVKWGVLRNIWSWAISEEFCVKGRLMEWLHLSFLVQIKFSSWPRLALNMGSWLSRSIFFITLWRHLLLSKSGKSRSQINVSSGPRFNSNMEEK